MHLSILTRGLLVVVLMVLTIPLRSQNPDLEAIGVNAFRAQNPSFLGNGIRVLIAEAGGSANTFEIDPAQVGQPVTLFTYYSNAGESAEFPNSIGTASPHANNVASLFVGQSSGVAPSVSHVDNYEGLYFYTNFLSKGKSGAPRIINQSFILESTVPTQVDANYDRFVESFDCLILSGAGNTGAPSTPSTAYNVVGVASLSGSSVGPTTDGRSKPDITAPAFATSFSTPQVSGVATILLQAAMANHGGAGTSTEASHSLTLKALLLNGARKPADWSNSSVRPLDPRYGAGVVNLFYSHVQLSAGRKVFEQSTTASLNQPQPVVVPSENSKASGWDYNSVSSSLFSDGANHYPFRLSTASPAHFTLTWNRHAGQTTINDLDLILHDVAGQRVVASSASSVDNVEHIYVPSLEAGEYDLRVVKKGGLTVSAAENYAVAWQAEIQTAPPQMEIARLENQIEISWPSSSGFVLETGHFEGQVIVWQRSQAVVESVSAKKRVRLAPSAETQFFRLKQP